MDTTRPSLNAALAQVILGELAARGIKSSELADKIGQPRSSISRRLNNQTPITTDHLDAIARGLGIDAEDLLHRAVERCSARQR